MMGGSDSKHPPTAICLSDAGDTKTKAPHVLCARGVEWSGGDRARGRGAEQGRAEQADRSRQRLRTRGHVLRLLGPAALDLRIGL